MAKVLPRSLKGYFLVEFFFLRLLAMDVTLRLELG
jgi:hypothetical protein